MIWEILFAIFLAVMQVLFGFDDTQSCPMDQHAIGGKWTKFCAEADTAVRLVHVNQPAEASRLFDHALSVADNNSYRTSIRRMAADAYGEAGSDAEDLQHWDVAVLNFGFAIHYQPDDPSLYEERGEAFERALKFPQAISDFARAIELDGNNGETYSKRGSAREMNLDIKGALADYDMAVRLNRTPDKLHLRGRAEAMLGDYASAERDLKAALAQAPGEPSTIFWLHLVHMKQDKDDRKDLQRLAKTAHDAWPKPALRYFLGEISSDELVRIDRTSSATAESYQRCDAWFYLGEESLALGRRDEARALFRETVQGCDALDYEWSAAQVELRRL